MSIIDIICGIVTVYGFWVGYSRGIIQTVFRILSIVIGLVAAFKFSPSMTEFLKDNLSDNPMMFILGFILTFIITMFLIRILASGIEGLFQTVNINFINQLAGGILSAAITILIYSSILWFADRSRLIDQNSKEDSITYPYLKQYPSIVWDYAQELEPVFGDFWDYAVDFMERLEDMEYRRQESEDNIYDLEEDDERQPPDESS